jgi:hypothetical protein
MRIYRGFGMVNFYENQPLLEWEEDAKRRY